MNWFFGSPDNAITVQRNKDDASKRVKEVIPKVPAGEQWRDIPLDQGDFIGDKKFEQNGDQWMYQDQIGWDPESFIPLDRDEFAEAKRVQQNIDALRRIQEACPEVIADQEGASAEEMIQQSDDPLKIIHYYTSCNGCQISPIVGARYKCTICADFNFCEECEQKIDHPHDFVKMKQCDEFDQFKHGLKKKRLHVRPAEWMKFDPDADSLVEELFNVRKGSQMKGIQGEVLEDKFKDDVRSDTKAEKNEEIQPEVLVKAEDQDEILKKVIELLYYFPDTDIQELYLYLSTAPKEYSLLELKEEFRLLRLLHK